MKYILFGTGDYYKRYQPWFADKEVVAVIDNDKTKQGTIIDGYKIISPEELCNYSYDYVVILSFYVNEMKEQLLALGVPEDKVIHFFDLHDVFEKSENVNRKKVLLLSHDMTMGGPALALYNTALVLKKNGYSVTFGSMLDGELRHTLDRNFIPTVVDRRLQICTMNEIDWTWNYDLLICNTIGYHVFLTQRKTDIPVIWWLHDSEFFYQGVSEDRLSKISRENLKILSVGPVPARAIRNHMSGVCVEDLIYGVSNGI